MKNLIIALIALTFTLGVACKKSNDIPVKEIKKEISVPKMANTPVGGGIGGYPGGANTYPHNTGLCYCGQYSVCHPTWHIEYDEHGNGHLVPN